jgi:hypothetical protein
MIAKNGIIPPLHDPLRFPNWDRGYDVGPRATHGLVGLVWLSGIVLFAGFMSLEQRHRLRTDVLTGCFWKL